MSTFVKLMFKKTCWNIYMIITCMLKHMSFSILYVSSLCVLPLWWEREREIERVNQNKLNNEINRLSKLCSSLQKQVSNKINAGSSHPDPPRQFSTQAIQVDTNSGLLHLNERKAPNRSDAHANPLVTSADIQVKQLQTTDRPKTRDKITNINKPTSSDTWRQGNTRCLSSVLHTNEQHVITYMVLQNIQLTLEYTLFTTKRCPRYTLSLIQTKR